MVHPSQPPSRGVPVKWGVLLTKTLGEKGLVTGRPRPGLGRGAPPEGGTHTPAITTGPGPSIVVAMQLMAADVKSDGWNGQSPDTPPWEVGSVDLPPHRELPLPQRPLGTIHKKVAGEALKASLYSAANGGTPWR